MIEFPLKDAQLKQTVQQITHQLNNKLMGMVGIVELLQQMSPEAKSLNDLEYTIQLMAHLLNNLQFVTSPLIHEKEIMSLRQLIMQICEVMSEDLNIHGIELEHDIDNTPMDIQGIPFYIEKAIRCLIDNAEQAIISSGQGDRIIIQLQKKSQNIRLVIEDNGPGIDPAQLALIRQEKGGGLGLAIVKYIVHLHQGQLHINSQVGKGTQVMMIFPKYSF